MVEWAVGKLKGVRPELLRLGTYYGGAKQAYATLAGLPVLNTLAPTVEKMAETIIGMTPLKPSPEEQAEQKSVVALDKKICDTLEFVDDAVDAKKDDVLEGVVAVKNVVKDMGPVQ
ncbi:unnamed protein product, partial [Discosporangium mesarthrocarpum]